MTILRILPVPRKSAFDARLMFSRDPEGSAFGHTRSPPGRG
jgi:hypothetical protein